MSDREEEMNRIIFQGEEYLLDGDIKYGGMIKELDGTPFAYLCESGEVIQNTGVYAEPIGAIEDIEIPEDDL